MNQLPDALLSIRLGRYPQGLVWDGFKWLSLAYSDYYSVCYSTDCVCHRLPVVFLSQEFSPNSLQIVRSVSLSYPELLLRRPPLLLEYLGSSD